MWVLLSVLSALSVGPVYGGPLHQTPAQQQVPVQQRPVQQVPVQRLPQQTPPAGGARRGVDQVPAGRIGGATPPSGTSDGPPTQTDLAKLLGPDLTVDPARVQVGEVVNFTLRLAPPPAMMIATPPRFNFVLNFDDDTSSAIASDPVSHEYRGAKEYKATVTAAIVGSRLAPQPIASVAVQVVHAVLRASTTSLEAGQSVRFSTRFRYPSNPDLVRYRFVAAEGTSGTWQSASTYTHRYDVAGTYEAHVDIGRVPGQEQAIDTSAALRIVVRPRAVPSPPPPPPPIRTTTQGSFNLWWLIVPLLVAAAGVVGYQRAKQVWANTPDFVPVLDAGTSSLADGDRDLHIDLQLVFERDVAGGEYTIEGAEGGLVDRIRRSDG